MGLGRQSRDEGKKGNILFHLHKASKTRRASKDEEFQCVFAGAQREAHERPCPPCRQCANRNAWAKVEGWFERAMEYLKISMHAQEQERRGLFSLRVACAHKHRRAYTN